MTPTGTWLLRGFVAVMFWSLWLVRSVLFRKVHATVCITAVARGDGKESAVRARISDAQIGTGLAVAACVALLAKKPPLVPGVYVPDEAWELDEVVQSMRDLAGSQDAIEIE